MTKTSAALAAFIAGCLAAGTASARPAALVIGNEEYEARRDVPDAGAREMRPIVELLEDARARVTYEADADMDQVLRAVGDFAEDAGDADGDPIVVVLAGRFLHVGGAPWFLPTDAPRPLDAESLPRSAVPVEHLAALISQAAEGAPVLIALAAEGPRGGSIFRRSAIVEGGVGPAEGLRVPVLSGDVEDVLALLQDEVLRPGGVVDADMAERADAKLDGTARLALFAAETASRTPLQPAVPSEEREYWEVVEGLDSETGYEAYLRRYPDGTFAAIARTRLDAIQADPLRGPRAEEDALDLAREERRAIQADLVTMGYNTRGVDGIFGPGSRGAIEGWQRDNDFEATGFVTAPQIDLLDRQAARRQAELDAEAETRRARIEAEDRAYWRQTGAEGGPRQLRRYLERYPDGLFAAEAEDRLDELAARGRGQGGRERRAFDDALAANTQASYRAYLEDYPRGRFAEEAQARLDQLRRDAAQNDALAAARREEESLGLNAISRRLAEQGLDRFGLEPGRVDGVFDENTRRALRRYQQARGLPVTGYMSQAVVVRMLAESVLR